MFVVNEPTKREDGREVRYLDLSDAGRYGEVIHLTPPGSTRLVDPEATARGIARSLHDYGPDDFLLAVGHPAMIAVASAVAARNAGGRLKVLVWKSRDMGDPGYYPVDVALWTEPQGEPA